MKIRLRETPHNHTTRCHWCSSRFANGTWRDRWALRRYSRLWSHHSRFPV